MEELFKNKTFFKMKIKLNKDFINSDSYFGWILFFLFLLSIIALYIIFSYPVIIPYFTGASILYLIVRFFYKLIKIEK